MLVVDKSKENLLTMKEKELEIGNNKEKSLQEYKAIALEIDQEIYNHLISKVEKVNLHDLSLEEQLVVLEEIDEEYTDVYEKQCLYINTYQEAFKNVYGSLDNTFELSDLSMILIDDIRNRIRVIQGYLINVKSIQENKEASEALNLDLIEESKKQDSLLAKYKELEVELKNNFLNTEGRNYDISGNLVYNSIATEYKNFELDLESLLNDSELIEKELNDVNEAKKASDEELVAAKLCYERMPSETNRDILDTIEVDNAKVNYKLALLYMANLVSKEYNEYASIILKRKQILSLNDERRHALELLGVNVSIDPFDRLRIGDQLSIISLLGDNNDRLEVIKRNIGNLDVLIDDKITQNNEYSLELKKDIQLMRKKIDYSSEIADYMASVRDGNNPTKVIDIKDPSKNMNMSIVRQKTSGVISRVNTMFSDVPTEDNLVVPTEEINPTLVVEPYVSEDIKIEEEKTPEIEPAIFDDAMNNSIELVFPEVQAANVEMPSLEPKEEPVDVFNDTVPFDDVSLFNERVSEDVFDEPVVDNNKQELTQDSNGVSTTAATTEAMPDVFWTVDENKQPEVTTEESSFDDQIDALIGDSPKVRKKVA